MCPAPRFEALKGSLRQKNGPKDVQIVSLETNDEQELHPPVHDRLVLDEPGTSPSSREPPIRKVNGRNRGVRMVEVIRRQSLLRVC